MAEQRVWGGDVDHLRITPMDRVPLERGSVPEFSVVVPGEVRGHSRPRARMTKQGPRAYTASHDLRHRARIEQAWTLEGAPRLPEDCYWKVRIDAVFQRPASHMKKDGELSSVGRRAEYPGKPDLDNVLKFIDVFVKCGAVPDDSRCAWMIATKRYATERYEAGTYFTFGTVDE